MRLQHGIGLIAVIFTLSGPVLADTAVVDSVQDQLTAALTAQGYEIVLVGHTWLGRLRIVAESDDLRREIVVNPHTGEVLRDYSVLLVATDRTGNGFEDDSDHDTTGIAATRVGQGDAALSGMEVMGDSVAMPVDPTDE